MPPAAAISDRDDLPKVEQVVSSQPLSHPQTLQMLSGFLMEEQERRTKLREDNNLNSTWKDLQNAYDTLAMPGYDDQGMAIAGAGGQYDTFDSMGGGGGGGGGGDHGEGDGGDDGGGGGVEHWSKRLAMAATSRTSSFLGSPDASAHKDKKARKERKKKRKDAKKDAKKLAKHQAKMMMGNRF